MPQWWYDISYDPLIVALVVMVGQWGAVAIHGWFRSKRR